MEHLDVRILGPLEVVSGGSRLPLGGQKQRAVLAILATRPGASVSADQLIEALWDGAPPATATTTVQVYVSRLRKLLGADRIATAAGGYALQLGADELDAARFRVLAGQGRPADALALWRGPALADFAYESWAQREAERLEEERLACLEQRIDADLEVGRHAELIGELEGLVAEHPLRERLRAQLMLALYRAGRQADALEAYQRARSMLVDELGIEPSPELQELNRRILQQQVEPAAPAGRRELPTGTVTLLATDIEGSTQLLAELGAEAYADALGEHRRLLREAFAAYGGAEVDTQGDAFLVAFTRASDAAAAAADAQRTLAGGPVRVRMGLHTGEPLLTDGGYVGMDVHRVVRIMSAGHGGQVLVSHSTRDLLDERFDLRNLGAHRLKDLTAPQQLYQLGEGEFPPLKTLHQTNLPVQPTPLIGREQELAEVLALLSEARLVSLTGAGGSGKTRLALQAAAELVEQYPHGVWWVSLAALRDPEFVEPTIAQVVGARDWLAEHLRGQNALLLLDNFEHLLAAAPKITALLTEASGVRVLATSRERLGIAAEQEYAVPTMVRVEALALFTARARQLKPKFEPDDDVVEICRRLDGLPLAIELAAARVKVLTPEWILERLGRSLDLLTAGARDAPERQRTLRATMEWSHELLDDAERRLFARLAVFAGSFDLEAAEAVCDARLDTLAALVDKSLLRSTEHGRFFMLETIRAYALERLEEMDGDELRTRHAAYFLQLGETAAPRLTTSEGRDWLARLEAELDNLRVALDWGFERAPDDALRLGTALALFWYFRDHMADAVRWLEAALPVVDRAQPSLRVRALTAAGRAAQFTNQPERASELFERAVPLARDVGETVPAAQCLSYLAMLALEREDHRRAESMLEEALGLVGRDSEESPRLLNALGYVLLDAGEVDRAKRALDESLDRTRAVGNVAGLTATTHSVGDLFFAGGDVVQAADRYREALRLALDTGTTRYQVYSVAGLAACAGLAGDEARAARLWGAVEAQEAGGGFEFAARDRPRYAEVTEPCGRRHPAEAQAGAELPFDDAVTEALAAVD